MIGGTIFAFITAATIITVLLLTRNQSTNTTSATSTSSSTSNTMQSIHLEKLGIEITQTRLFLRILLESEEQFIFQIDTRNRNLEKCRNHRFFHRGQFSIVLARGRYYCSGSDQCNRHSCKLTRSSAFGEIGLIKRDLRRRWI